MVCLKDFFYIKIIFHLAWKSVLAKIYKNDYPKDFELISNVIID